MSHPRLGCNVHQASAQALNLAASLGISIVRIDANIADLWVAPEQWAWTWLDELLATCRTLQLTPYATMTQSPRWMGVEPGQPPPLDLWVQFCETFARRYADQLTYVGVWNEFQGSAAEYVSRLLRPMADIFRRVDAGYRICGPEMEMRQDWPQWLRTILRDGGDCLDVLTVHCYEDTGAQVWDKLTKPRRWWEVWKDPSVLEVIKASGYGDRPLWLTEVGFRSDRLGEEGQATQADQILERVLGSEKISGLLWFQLLDESSDGGHGVFRLNETIKPVGQVIQRLALPLA